MELETLLLELNACEPAREWARGKTLREAWDTCDRADWILWLAMHMSDKPGWPTRQQVVLATCACSETSLQFVPKGEDHPRIAIETTKRWTVGEASSEEVLIAARKAYEASFEISLLTAKLVYIEDLSAGFLSSSAGYSASAAGYSAIEVSPEIAISYVMFVVNATATSHKEKLGIVRQMLKGTFNEC